MSNWKKHKLSEIIELIGGGTPKTTNPEYWGGEIGWLSVVDFNNGMRRVYDAEKHITKKGLEESSTKILKKGQIIISARGTVGAIAQLGKDMAFNQSCYGINARSETTNDFLYYLIKYNLSQIKSNVHGAVFDTITKQTFDHIKVEIPENINDQHRISTILASLDDKTELNSRMNKTLEQMAQAILKKWFPYGKDEIDLPKGSRKIKLVDLLDTISVTHEFPNDKIIFLNTGDVYEGQVLHSQYSDVESLPGQAKKSIEKHDILYSEIRPINRHFAFIDFDSGDYVVSTKLMVLRSKGIIDPIVLYFFLKSSEVISELQMIAESRSGTFPQITFDEIKSLEIAIPPKDILSKYTTILQNCFSKISHCKKESTALSQFRDTLLPQLMNGEIGIKKKEKELA